jgi:hypothetical protein
MPPQRLVIVAIGNGAAGDSNEMGRLSTSQGLAISLLALVVLHRLQSAFQVQLPHANGGIATDAEGFAGVLVSPAFGHFEQYTGAGESAGIGFARMDARVQRGSLAFGQTHRNGMLIRKLLAFPSSSQFCQYQTGLTSSNILRNGIREIAFLQQGSIE